MRKQEMSAGRSINLALSKRGMDALQRVGVLDRVMPMAIPMFARAIHDLQGNVVHSNYSKDGVKHINSVSRAQLNQVLMTAAEDAGAKINFGFKCLRVDLPTRSVQFQNLAGQLVVESPALLVGADGAFSGVRNSLVRTDRFSYSQDYLAHGYKELTIPPTAAGEFALHANRLHIWPRGHFMMIALPNPDKSFTCTLFAPFEGRDSFALLRTPADVRAFFDTFFRDAVPLMPTLVEDFFANPTPSLVTVRCNPWSRDNFATLLGDAAHAVVPFFGQGMNAAFEDCVALSECIANARAAPQADDAAADWRAAALAAYEARRIANSNAIADMALENFIEMRDKTADPEFLFRKEVAHLLGNQFPDRFLARYERVSFSLIPYTEALRIGKINDTILDAVIARLGTVRDVSKVDLEHARQLCETQLPLINQKDLE
jgi:kynurenine 3-monooxygenase